MSTDIERAARGLVLAPHGRDAALAADLAAEARIDLTIARDLPAFVAALSHDVQVAALTEEAVRGANLRPLAAWVADQPSWSDLPFLVLTRRGGGPERNPAAARLSEVLGNVSFLERPFHPTTFISLLRSGLRARQRQYEARARIDALHDGEERLQTALIAGQLGAWELDIDNERLETSATFRATFGRRPDEPFHYDDLLAAVHAQDQPRLRAAIRAAVEHGEDFVGEFRCFWPNGEAHWADARARLVSRGGQRRLVGVISDVTDRKRAEEELRGLNEMLEERVRERTSQLETAHADLLAHIEQREQTEAQLRQAQKMEAVGQLTGGVAHDFNNMLMIIKSSVDFLRRPDLAPARREHFIQAIADTADRAAKLTGQLLAFARRQPLKPEVFDLARRVALATDLVQPLVGSRIVVDFIAETGDAPIFVDADASQLETALVNLAVNARDAMDGQGRITFAVGAADAIPPAAGYAGQCGDFAVVRITDTGCGIDPAQHQAIFEPFYTTKAVGKGTGLGLSQVFGFAKQSGGEIQVRSAPGEGSTFILYLPRQAQPTHVADAAAIPPPERRRALSVLVVEDNEAVSHLAAEMLQELGHETTLVHNAEAALATLERDGRSIDIVFSDVIMPGMNGVDLAHAVRSRLPQLPVLLTSGYSDVLAQEGSHGFEFLRKPYSTEELSRALAKAAGRGG